MVNVSTVFTRSSEKQEIYARLFFTFLSLSLSVLLFSFPLSLSVPFFFFVRFRPAVFSSYVEYRLFPLFIFRPFQRASLKRGTTFYGGN